MNRLVLAALVALFAPAALAQTCTTSWTNAAGGAWETATNWSDGLPDAVDTACITLAGTYTVATDRTDRTVAGLIVGGASGAQTLTTFNRFTVSGDARVAPGGRWELLNRTPGGGDGLLMGGTLLVEGVFVHNGGTTLLDGGGVLEVAPGGRWEMRDGASAGVEARPGTFRLRGTLDAAFTSTQTVAVPLDVQGGTVRVSQGRLDVRGGVLANATVDAAAGATLLLVSTAAAPFTVSGTLVGAPAGEVYFNGGTFAATPGEATLALGGTGLLLGGSVNLTSGGGTFLNTGRLTHAETSSNFATLNGTTLRNTGRFVMPGRGFGFQNGGLFRNEASGVAEIANGGGFGGVGGSAGRVENAGLVVHTANSGGGTGTTGSIGVPYDGLPGSTLRTETGRLDLTAGGSIRDAAFDVPGGTTLRIAGSAPYTVSGTLSGTPGGDLVAAGTSLVAGPGGATLAVGGTGLALGSTLRSAGGSFVNTGLLVWNGGSSASAVVVENRGTARLVARVPLLQGAVLRNVAGATTELFAFMDGDGRFENAGLVVTGGNGFSASFGGRLRSLPGSEIRALRGGPRFDLQAPASRSVPDGTTLTGTGRLLLPRDLEIEGAVSPGTLDLPLARLESFGTFRPSLVAGSPRLVVDVDAAGRSDTLAIGFSSGLGNTRLGGALVVRVRPGFVPAVGNQWTILTSESPDGITGQFSQIVAENAPAGIAFVAERAANGASLTLRAVAVGTGGPVTVSTTTPVGGGMRSLFLTGPGAPGITAARLECVQCLDPDSLGVIPATLVGAGTLREARFDLTSPRAFGLFNLVMEQPGQPNEVVPVTVRPFVSYIQVLPTVVRGMRVRPPNGPGGGGYNWSHYNLWNVSNVLAPAYTFAAAGRQDTSLVAFAVASGSPFSSGVLFYESETAADPTADALLYARITPRTPVPLAIGQRIAPADVRFPEQPSSGPDDPRIAFGDPRLVTVSAVQHTTFERARFLIDGALRTTGHAPLGAYLAQVDASDAGAVRASVEAALQSETRYVGGTAAMLVRLLSELNATVATPGGLAAGATTPFEASLDRYAGWHYRDLEQAYRIDLAAAPVAVQTLLQAEYDALVDPTSLGLIGGGIGGICRKATSAAAAAAASAGNNQVGTAGTAVGAAVCSAQPGPNSPPPGPPPGPPMPPAPNFGPTIRCIGSAFRNIALAAAANAGGQRGASCDPGGGGGAGGGAAGGGACGPPQAPADPNDKTTEASTLCEIGTVIVDGQPQARCVRYFVPLADADEPIPYTVQFENLPQATANAEFVTVTDTLDADLDPATLEVYATSSDSTFSYAVVGQVVTFRFVGIDLPPNVDEPEGQGYITYGVEPRAGLPTGTVIENEASIVFDFNPPILTPTVVHEIRQAADVSTTILAPDFVVEGQPIAFEAVVANLAGDFASDATVTLSAGGLAMTALPSTGTCTGSGPVTCSFGALEAGTFARVAVEIASPPLGLYTLRSSAGTTAFDAFAPNNVEEVTVGVATVGVEVPSGLPAELTLSSPWPNPSRGDVRFRIGLPAAGAVDVRVYDLLGREVARLAEGEPGEAGWHETEWDARALASGVYVVRLTVGDEVRTRRITVLR